MGSSCRPSRNLRIGIIEIEIQAFRSNIRKIHIGTYSYRVVINDVVQVINDSDQRM
jgi:hypothetical protein